MQSMIKTLKEVFPYVKIAVRKKDGSNNLVYAALGENIIPTLDGSYYKEIQVDDRSGVLITDDKNPIDILAAERYPEFIKSTKEVFGYEPLFSL